MLEQAFVWLNAPEIVVPKYFKFPFIKNIVFWQNAVLQTTWVLSETFIPPFVSEMIYNVIIIWYIISNGNAVIEYFIVFHNKYYPFNMVMLRLKKQNKQKENKHESKK